MLQELSTEIKGNIFLGNYLGFFKHFVLTENKHLWGFQSAVLYHTICCFSVLLLEVS